MISETARRKAKSSVSYIFPAPICFPSFPERESPEKNAEMIAPPSRCESPERTLPAARHSVNNLPRQLQWSSNSGGGGISVSSVSAIRMGDLLLMRVDAFQATSCIPASRSVRDSVFDLTQVVNPASLADRVPKRLPATARRDLACNCDGNESCSAVAP